MDEQPPGFDYNAIVQGEESLIHRAGVRHTPGTDGGRYKGKMEDRAFMAGFSDVHITAAEAHDLIKDTLLKAGDEAVAHTMKCGSTASLAMITSDHQLVGGNVGDSPIFLIHEKADGTFGHAILHTDHGAQQLAEELRAKGGIVIKGRLIRPDCHGSLMLGKAIGDHVYREAGLDHTPSMFTHDLKPYLQDSRRAWVFVASDGIAVPRNGELDVHVAHVKQLVKEHCAQGGTIAQLLDKHMNQALKDGTYFDDANARHVSDNIAITCAEVNGDFKGAQMLGVADGHGGHEAADLVHAHMEAAGKQLSNFKVLEAAAPEVVVEHKGFVDMLVHNKTPIALVGAATIAMGGWALYERSKHAQADGKPKEIGA